MGKLKLNLNMSGKVFLVGAGPGNPDLLTLKAYKLLTTATCVVYDRLVSQEILSLIPESAEMIYVGKAPGKHSLPQEQINDLLVKLGLEGRQVIRLKGGDPFIFGRGGEECLILKDHEIPFEIIPGITTAQAVSTGLGLPLTHRGCATSVRYITGCCAGNLKADMDWNGLADGDTTLVVYMGLGHAEEIAENLMKAGMPSNMEVALIQNASRKEEKFTTTTLDQLAYTVRTEGFKPPTLIIIGHVVKLAEQIGDFSPYLMDDKSFLMDEKKIVNG